VGRAGDGIALGTEAGKVKKANVKSLPLGKLACARRATWRVAFSTDALSVTLAKAMLRFEIDLPPLVKTRRPWRGAAVSLKVVKMMRLPLLASKKTDQVLNSSA